MKKIILLISTFLTFQGFAQKIVIQKGQKITINQTDNGNIIFSIMGQEMTITSNNTITTLLEVKSVADNNNVISNTLKRVKISSEGMGSMQTYDSENPADKNSIIGKPFEDKLNKSEEVTIDNMGKELNTKKMGTPAESSDPMDMIKMSDFSAGGNVSSAFMVLPAKVKTGYSWTDSATIDKIKTAKTYTVKSIQNNEAVIGLVSTITGEKSVSSQGMEMNVHINTTINGEITSDISTGLVKKNVLITEMNNSMDMMGSSNPMTGKINTTITYTAVP